LGVLQFAGGRHTQRSLLPDGAHQQTLRRLARHNRRSTRAALEQSFTAVQPKSAHGRGGRRMTGLALPRQQRPHLGFEEIAALVRCRQSSAGVGAKADKPDDFHHILSLRSGWILPYPAVGLRLHLNSFQTHWYTSADAIRTLHL